MKTVVIIAPQFSPCSYPPAIRVRFFTNHLEKFGWHPVVLTVAPEYMEEPPDWEFARMIPEDLEVIRVKAFSPRWTRKIGIGDLGIRCFPHMLRQLKAICRTRRVDALFIPGPPWHTFLLGPLIKREFGIPYVLDYIDPWVSSWGEGEPPWKKAFWYRQMAIVLEPFAVRQADHIIAVSEGTNEGVRVRYPFLKQAQFTAIPYGGEPADFEYLRQNPRPNPHWNSDDGNFHFSYVGAMLPKAYGTLRALFAALLKMREKDPEIYRKLRFHFIGTTYDPQPKKGLVMPVAEEMGVDDIVTEHPKRVPYLDAANILCQSDAIFAMGTSEKHYTASKIFPAILSRRPILALYHEESSVVDILETVRRAEITTYSDSHPIGNHVDNICDKLKVLVKNGNLVNSIEVSESFNRMTALHMTKLLVDSLCWVQL